MYNCKLTIFLKKANLRILLVFVQFSCSVVSDVLKIRLIGKVPDADID